MSHFTNYKSLYQPLFFIPFFLIFTACTEVEQEQLTISSSPWPGYEPLYLARDRGFFDSNKVKLFELPSADITMESFRNHSTNLASLPLDATLELLDEGAKLRILLIMDISNGGDVVMAKPEIKKLSDIKGKRISVVNIPLGLYMLNRLLDKAGLQRNDVEVFFMAETHQEEFYDKGKADVIITFDPVKSKLAKKGMHVLFDSSDIPNEIFDLLVAHEDAYKNNFDDICAIGKQWFNTLDYMKNNRKETSEYIGKRLGVDVDSYNEMMKGLIVPSIVENNKLLTGNDAGLLDAAKKLSSIMIKEKQLSKVVDVSAALDSSYMGCVSK